MGFVPGILLLGGLALRNSQRLGASDMLTVGSIGASLAFWVIYTVVLALIVVVGGFRSGKIGLQKTHPEITAQRAQHD